MDCTISWVSLSPSIAVSIVPFWTISSIYPFRQQTWIKCPLYTRYSLRRLVLPPALYKLKTSIREFMVLLPLDSKYSFKVGLDGSWSSFYSKYIQFTSTLFCMNCSFQETSLCILFSITLLLLGKQNKLFSKLLCFQNCTPAFN